jgi:hypothetical protein
MSRSPDLAPMPEEGVVDKSQAPVIRSRSGLNLQLQERLLSCGSVGALRDDDEGTSRRPSVSSANSSIPERESDDASHVRMARVHPSPVQANTCSLLVRGTTILDRDCLHRSERVS